MLSSLLVLAAFLAFWLNGAYRNAKATLTERGNSLYLESVREVQDSVYSYVIRGFIQKAEANDNWYADSLPHGLGKVDVRLSTYDGDTEEDVKEDRFPTKEKTRFRQLGLSITADTAVSTDTLIFIERLEAFEHLGVSKRDDGLQDQILKRFDNYLAKNELPLAYNIQQKASGRDTTDLRFFPGDFNTFLSEEVVFAQATPYLLSKISGQLLFSIFLFCLTGLAFYTMHRSNQRALQYTQLKSDFMSNMTHELKTPITTIGLALEAMEGFVRNEDTGKTNEYLQISQHELGRLSLLVDKVLKLSLFENDVPKLKREPTDLRLIVGKVQDAMRIQMEQRGGRFNVSTEGDSFHLLGDPVHLTNVLFNLLDNSLKYAKDAPEVDIKLEQRTGQILLQVCDNGIGIPKEYRSKVFERFFRVPSVGDRHDVKGYGLGLSYVADIIKQHGGQIELSPNEPQGTCFTITLPSQEDAS